MRRLTTVLLAACLMSVSAGVASAQTPSPTPDIVGIGGRLALPESGFALTYPDDWVWVRYSSEDFDTVMAQLADLTSPEFVAEHEDGFSKVDPDMPLLGGGLDQGGGCGVVVLQPTGLTLDAAAADLIARMEAQPDTFPAGATVTDVALPAGQAKRIDGRQVAEGLHAPTDFSLHLATDGSRFYLIRCAAVDPPDDAWLSVAETFEFLPAEE
jgi:hypothetical protein